MHGFELDAYPALKNPFARSGSPLTTASGTRDERAAPSRHGGSNSAKSSFSRTAPSAETGITSPLRGAPQRFAASAKAEEPEEDYDAEPRAPTEFALRSLFVQFVTIADGKLEEFLRAPLESEPPLRSILGPGAHTPFDRALASLAQLAQKHAAKVVESVSRWKKTHNGDTVSADITKHHVQNSIDARIIRTTDVKSIMKDRKTVASEYIWCRALIVILGSVPPNGLGERLGQHLEQLTFNQYQTLNFKLAQSPNHRANAALYGQLLSQMSTIRFVTLADRFVSELSALGTGQVPKEAEPRFEHIVRGLQHLQIKAFEEAAEFMEPLSKCVAMTHGSRLKLVFAESLIQLLHPIAKTAQAEVNHPQWAAAMEAIYPKAKEMIAKKQYWVNGYPLLVVALCVAPRDFFLQNWSQVFELGVTKLKERAGRQLIMNAIVRLLWVYIYRCNESASAVTVKLAAVTKPFFPPPRIAGLMDDQLDALTYIVHFILLRHVEYGQDLIISLTQEPSPEHASSDRVVVGVRAVLMTLQALDKDVMVPSWPSTWDLNKPIPDSDYPVSASRLPDSFWEAAHRATIAEFRPRLTKGIEATTRTLGHKLSRCCYFDTQFAASKVTENQEERDSYVMRDHGQGRLIAYSKVLVPDIAALQACFDSLPRCLWDTSHSGSPLEKVLDLLCTCTVNVEPTLCASAEKALVRFASDELYATRTAGFVTRYLFNYRHLLTARADKFLMVELEPLLKVWLVVIAAWQKVALVVPEPPPETEEGPAPPIESLALEVLEFTTDLQAAALFLLTFNVTSMRAAGIKVLTDLHNVPRDVVGLMGSATAFSNIFFDAAGREFVDDPEQSNQLESQQRARMAHWKKQKDSNLLLRIAECATETDKVIWRNLLLMICERAWSNHPRIMRTCRASLLAAVVRYRPLISAFAGLKTTPAQTLGRTTKERQAAESLPLEQWKVWIRVLCHTAFDGDPGGVRPPPETGAGSFEDQWERASSARGLFKLLIPFVSSQSSTSRLAVVSALGSVPPTAIQVLLEDLKGLVQYMLDVRRGQRQHSDEVTAVAQIHSEVSKHLKDPMVVAHQPTFSLVAQFLRDMDVYLRRPDVQQLWDMQRLRRYFCGIVERVFDARELDYSMEQQLPSPLLLFRLCDGWCHYGPRSAELQAQYNAMQQAAVDHWPDRARQEKAQQYFHTESVGLSVAASGAIAVLCRPAIDYTLNPPPQYHAQNQPAPDALDLGDTLERFLSMLGSGSTAVVGHGKRAVRTLLTTLPLGHYLADEMAHRAFVSSADSDAVDSRFFAMLEDVITDGESHPFTFEQLVAIGLANLSNSQLPIRKQSLSILSHSLGASASTTSLRTQSASVCSAASSVYLRAVQHVSGVIAMENANSAPKMITQITGLLMDSAATQLLHSVLLQSLRPWISAVDLLPEGFSSISQEGVLVILHLLALTSRYYVDHPSEVTDLWLALADLGRPMNGGAMIHFLIDLVTNRDNIKLTAVAVQAIACLSNTEEGSRAMQDLCGFIGPRSMLPPPENIVIPPSNLDTMFPRSSSRSGLARGQVAFVLLSDLAIDRAWDLSDTLPIILHVLFIHLDHRSAYIRDHALRLLLHSVRSWLPAYDEGAESNVYTDDAYSRIEGLQDTSTEIFKASSHDPENDKFAQLLEDVLAVLEPLHSSLRQDWGELAVHWGTSCAIRNLAFGSLKLFRLIMPTIDRAMLGSIIGRLQNTISDPDENFQAFTVEIMRTMTALIDSPTLDVNHVPQLFWCALACLTTTVEDEYVQALAMAKALLNKIDLGDSDSAAYLEEMTPPTWSSASADLQTGVMVGLRSAVTSDISWELLQRLIQVGDAPLVGKPASRVRDAFAVWIPWSLQAIDDKKVDTIADYAMNLSFLAEQHGYPSIQRVMISYAKQRFRTRDDYLRQALGCLREHFAGTMGDICTLLLGLVLNKTRWLQLRTMEVLKVLFTHRETWNPIRLAGSELLMPLLRLLPTDLAPQALEVLDQPIAVFGGPSAAQVVRMSMSASVTPNIFGAPQESGWSVARPDTARQLTRMNLLAVFDTCKDANSDMPSTLVFENEDDPMSPVSARSIGQRQFKTSLTGGASANAAAAARNTVYGITELLSNLHALTSYFAEDGPSQHAAEDKVSRILAFNERGRERQRERDPTQQTHGTQSSSDSAFDNVHIPPTPLVDLFGNSTPSGQGGRHGGGPFASNGGGGRIPDIPEGYFPDFDQSDGSDETHNDSFVFDDGGSSRHIGFPAGRQPEGRQGSLTGLGYGRTASGLPQHQPVLPLQMNGTNGAHLRKISGRQA
ncbi:cell morphogenesis N-terminal-domain-containing protein [Auriculariales sp. MPI-PUGE-AT-0066]|nr:cell morphogenesis N-terminal-domain-containing protein [Auriculariales sp. MPI-PUGE-AT-0066]